MGQGEEKGRRERERKREKGGVNESMSAKKGGREEGNEGRG